MTRYYFDCLCNGELHLDEYGIEMLDEEIADQAMAVMVNILEESFSDIALLVVVTVRSERGKPVYVASGVAGGNAVR